MAFLRVSFGGKSLGLQSSMNVLVPEEGSGPFPVFYLLHGLSDDQWAWMRRTAIERYVSGLPLIVVMPTTGRGWYSNSVSDPQRAYEDHMVKDVVGFVDRVFPTVKSREGRVIGGLSMGGYGAVKLGLKYPEMFCSVTSHSGAVSPFRTPAEKKAMGKGGGNAPAAAFVKEFEGIFGKNGRGGENDPLALAKKCPKKLRPKLRVDCGVADFLIQQNREFHGVLEKMGYEHVYEELPAEEEWLYSGALNKWTGGHDWHYWDYAVQEAIVFHCGVLGVKLPFVRKRGE